MTGLIDYLPDANTLISLGAEDLGMILLGLVQQEKRPMFTPSDFEMPLWNANLPAYPHHKKRGVSRTIAEAWQWLQNEGLIMNDPEQSDSWFCLTRKGAALRSEADIEAYRQGNILPVGLLHIRLAEKVLPMFLRGDYDVAVFQAFKEVEVIVRNATGQPDDQVGVNLMRAAFKPANGPLTDMTRSGGERQAMMDLYAGAIGHAKNPPSHREVQFDRVAAAQLIIMASYLLIEADAMAILTNTVS
jgi:uncharacterized protein (TIGR02391 family)